MELSDGSVGWGEAPTMPPVTAEDQPSALAAAALAGEWLRGQPVDKWQQLLKGLQEYMPGHQYASVRAGMDMAVLDALARSRSSPLWKFFGGVASSVSTDITIPICPAPEARQLAEHYCARGFVCIKTKVGGTTLLGDVERLRAIRRGHPKCVLVLDANGGYSPPEALNVLDQLDREGLRPLLLEQPVARGDWAGLGHVSREARARYGVLVAADESCRSPADARRIGDEHLAHVINIKLAKLGLLGALEVMRIARRAKLGLMIGGMVETRIAMGFAAHLAAGVGGFRYIDLDTPLLLAADPVKNGYRATGSEYDLGESPGHGGSLDWD